MRTLLVMLSVTLMVTVSAMVTATAMELAIGATDASGFKFFKKPDGTYEVKTGADEKSFAIIDVLRSHENGYNVLVHSPANKIAIKENDQIVMTAKVRVIGDRADEGNVGLYGESAVDSKKAFLGGIIYPTRELKTFRRHYLSPIDFEIGEFRLSIHLGLKSQTLELHELSAEVYPADFDIDKIPMDQLTWPGRSLDAPWRVEANQRIETIRKQDAKIVVNDAEGNAISGAKVIVKQKRHAFPFGTFVGEKMLEDSVDGQNYRKTLKENYNFITLPAYLANWGWLNDKKRKNYFRMADWAKANGFQTRGHLLVYPGWAASPGEWFELPKPELLEKLNAHIFRATNALADRGVRDWDVTNELRYNEQFMNEIGGVAVAAEWFKLARQCNPQGHLSLSETAILSNRGETEMEQATFEKHHKILIDAGAPIDGICLHGHFNTALTSPMRLKEIFDRMTKLGDVMVTEFDLDNSDKGSQADYLRDFYTVCFSHPSVRGVNQWGFWEADMWRPRGHLIDRNWNETVSFKAYRDLVYGAWWTDQSGETNDTGEFELRGFKGTHTVTVEHEGYIWSGEMELGDDFLKIDVVVP